MGDIAKSRGRRLIIIALATVGIAVPLMLLVPRNRYYAEAQSVGCRNNVTSISLASLMWAHDNQGHFPTTFKSMSNELITPKILVCPADRARQRAPDWSSFADVNSSYEILRPDMAETETNAFLRCRVHGHLGFADGTVFDGKRRRKKFE